MIDWGSTNEELLPKGDDFIVVTNGNGCSVNIQLELSEPQLSDTTGRLLQSMALLGASSISLPMGEYAPGFSFYTFALHNTLVVLPDLQKFFFFFTCRVMKEL